MKWRKHVKKTRELGELGENEKMENRKKKNNVKTKRKREKKTFISDKEIGKDPNRKRL